MKEKPPTTMSSSERRQHRLYVGVGISLLALALLAVACILFEVLDSREPRSDQQRPLPAQDDISEIKSIIEHKYSEVVDLVNRFEHQAALEALQGLEPPGQSIHDIYIRGILFAWIGEDDRAAQLLTQASRSHSEPLTSRVLEKNASKWEIDPDAIGYRHFTSEDSRYIRRCFFVQTIADHATKGCRTDREKIDQLLEWVFRHVAFFEPKLIDISPVDVLLRGYGLCDRSAWVLSLLCIRSGLPANVLFLGRPISNLSSHTLCQVLVSGEWLLCDTTQGILLTFEDGTPATLDEIIRRFNQNDSDGAFREKYGSFEKAGVGVVCEGRGAFPRFELLEPYLQCIPPYASAFADLLSRYETAVTCLAPERNTKVQIGFWDYPFFSLSSYSDPESLRRRREVLSHTLHYRRARILQLVGMSDQAMIAYATSIEDAPAEAKEDILFFIAQTQQEAGHLQAAENNYSRYLSTFPEGQWTKQVIYHLARLKEDQGDYSAAIALYRRILDVTVAARRAAELERTGPRASEHRR